MKMENLKSKVLTILPAEQLIFDAAEALNYGHDWNKKFKGQPSAVVFPKSTAEVQSILKLCNEHEIKVVPSGGRTGLSGGACVVSDEIVLSLEKMNKINDPDLFSLTIECEAGATTEAIKEKCEAFDLTYPITLASQGSSQIGGNVATNAGGVHVVRFGSTRNWVLGMTVVTISGEILHINRALEKNNSGLDLRHIFIGSEGTLGVITAVTLKLTREKEWGQTLFFSLESRSKALNFFQELRLKSSLDILAFEYISNNCVDLVCESFEINFPLSEKGKVYLLVEVNDLGNSLDAILEEALESELILDGTIAQSLQQKKHLWSLRENITESLAKAGVVHQNDISVPLKKLKSFFDDLTESYQKRYADFELYIFGHLGDGNLHANVLNRDLSREKEFFNFCAKADQDMFRLIQSYGGSISAEHGIGLAKKAYLQFSAAANEIEIMKSIKQVLDPKRLLNPGKIFD